MKKRFKVLFVYTTLVLAFVGGGRRGDGADPTRAKSITGSAASGRWSCWETVVGG